MTLLHRLYLLFDATIQCYDAYKVETIGDAYMVASGVPVKTHLHAANICTLALELLENLKNFKIKENSLTDETLKLRIGIHSGIYHNDQALQKPFIIRLTTHSTLSMNQTKIKKMGEILSQH